MKAGLLALVSGMLAASTAHAGCKLPPISVEKTIEDHFRHSVAKVVAGGPMAVEKVEIGSAFLVDKRGYFMTAAHVVNDPVAPGASVSGANGSIEVVVASHVAEVYAPATVIGANEMLDVAVLRADLGAAYLYEDGVRRGIDGASLLHDTPPLPLRVGIIPVDGEAGQFIGYRKERADGTGPLVFDTGKFAVRQTSEGFNNASLLEKAHMPDALVAEGEVFEGHSGSPLIDDEGYVFAVVTHFDVPRKQTLDYYQRSEDLQRRRIRATHMLFASCLLDKVPMTEQAELVSRQLRNKDTVSSVEEAYIEGAALTPLSWLTLTAEIMREPAAYLGALKAERGFVHKIYQESVEHCILSRADRWMDFLYGQGIDPKGYSLAEFYEQFTQAKESGAGNAELLAILRPSIDAYRMELERDPDYGPFDVVELPAEVRGRLHRELAELQVAALQAGDERVLSPRWRRLWWRL